VSDVLLNDTQAFIRRFVVLSDAQADAATLWAAHTHAFDCFEATPYLYVSSPEKRSGKTRLLEVLELLAWEPLPAMNISDAALFRAVHELRPSLLLDEADAVFKARDREELRGMLNAGYRRGAYVMRMGGVGAAMALERFSVYCPKVMAGIGDCLPDTITDRSIRLHLKRRTRSEVVERFRRREVAASGWNLRDRLAEWLEPQHDYLAANWPDLPEELDDRAQDVWEPLLAIADLAGGTWPDRARSAARTLSSGEEREDTSLTATLIRDIAAVFSSNGHKAYKTADLLEHLYVIEESPWGDYYGKPMSAHTLSQILRPYRIKTMPVRIGADVVRGYRVEQFRDAFAQVSVTSVTGVTSEARSQAECNAATPCNADGAEPGDDPDADLDFGDGS
jgi:hypothetical protein